MRLIMVTTIGLLCMLGGAFAAGPFDGTWSGTVEQAGARCPQGAITMRITDTDIVGHFSLGGAQVPFRGTVSADGAVNVAYNYPQHSVTGTMTGKIAGSDFTGRFNSIYQGTHSSCTRNVTAKRA